MVSKGVAGKINIFCLLGAIIAVLIFPLKKEIWYDETVSILCSKGISHDTPTQFSNSITVSSTTIEQLNTAGNVFNATVLDNGNSFLYNILLHWATLLFGNSVIVYMLLSKLCTVALLIAFYVLCNLFFERSIFTALAVLLLATDINTSGMSAEIRAYALATFFVTIAAIYFYKFLFQNERPFYLFLAGMFSVCAVLSHFLSVYIVLVFLGALLVVKRASLFSFKNIMAMLAPIVVTAIFFWFSYSGLEIMGRQNHEIQKASQGFSFSDMLFLFMKFTAINFKVVFPAFSDKGLIVILSFFLSLVLYIEGVRATGKNNEKRNIHLLFILGASSSVFLSLLCIKSGHLTAFYYRYFSFCIPFCCIFIAYIISVILNNQKIKTLIKHGIISAIVLPVLGLYAVYIYRAHPKVKYNHVAIAQEIVRDHVIRIEIPQWKDALLVQSFLPAGYKINYVLNPLSPYFTIYKPGTVEQIPVIRNDT